MRVWSSSKITACLLSCFVAVYAHAGSTLVVENFEVPLVGQMHELNVNIDYQFDEAVLEALNNGVALTLVLDIEVVRKRNYIWDEVIVNLKRRSRLEFHALSRQYVINDLNAAVRYTYLSMGAAIRALGSISRLPLLDHRILEAGKQYQIRLRPYIDVEELPPPLRPVAYISPEWKLTDEWKTWPLQN